MKAFGAMAPSRRGVLRLLGGAALAVTLAGCGIPMDSGPRDVAAPDQPFPVNRPSPAAADAGNPYSDPVVYFLLPRPNERLVAAPRSVGSGADELMPALLGKLTADEMKQNWRTAIPPSVKFVGSAYSGNGDTIVVKLTAPKDASFLQGEDGVRVAAQIVYTVLGVPGAKSVQVELNGELQKLLDDQGTVLNRPAVKADYHSYDPNAPAIATTGSSTTIER